MDLSSLPLQQFSRAELLALAHRLLDYLSRIPPGPDESTSLLGVEGHASAGQKGVASGVARGSYALQASQEWSDRQRGQKAVPANACDDNGVGLMNESAPALPASLHDIPNSSYPLVGGVSSKASGSGHLPSHDEFEDRSLEEEDPQYYCDEECDP